MKILSTEEEVQLVPSGGKTPISSVRRSAFALKAGQTLFLPRKEWKTYKYAPSTTIGSLLYHKNIKFSTRLNKLGEVEGYAIKRKK